VKDAVKQTAKASASAKQESAPVAAPAPEAVAPKRTTAAARKAAVAALPAPTLPPVKGETKDGIKFTKDFDAKFLANQRKLLLEARESLTGQAVRLEDEANSLIDDEVGDVQFDDESGEGDTMVVERERDLFLSARARQDIEEIDGALRRLEVGSYGYSVVSYKPIPRERLEAIPWATELTEEKVGGIGRRCPLPTTAWTWRATSPRRLRPFLSRRRPSRCRPSRRRRSRPMCRSRRPGAAISVSRSGSRPSCS
jgi:RNA polymerase-binding transcription factor DksA